MKNYEKVVVKWKYSTNFENIKSEFLFHCGVWIKVLYAKVFPCAKVTVKCRNPQYLKKWIQNIHNWNQTKQMKYSAENAEKLVHLITSVWLSCSSHAVRWALASQRAAARHSGRDARLDRTAPRSSASQTLPKHAGHVQCQNIVYNLH